MIPTLGRREKPIKIGVEVVRHAKYVTYQFAKDAVPRELFVAILERIQRFVVPEPAQADGSWWTRNSNAELGCVHRVVPPE